MPLHLDAQIGLVRSHAMLLSDAIVAKIGRQRMSHAALALTGLALLLFLLSWPPAPTEARAPSAQELRADAAFEKLPYETPAFAAATGPTLSLSEAARLNAEMPIAALPNPAAQAFIAAAGTSDAARSLECLTAAVYYEAASEDVPGRRAVAQVVLNRVRHPAFPKTVCGVVFQGAQRAGGSGCQFSFTCDGALGRARALRPWAEARIIAAQALAGHVEPSVGLATHYHTVDVVPFWRTSLTKVAVIGAHIFYRWSGAQGEPAAFIGRYRGGEEAMKVLVRRAATTVADPVDAMPAPMMTAAAAVVPVVAQSGAPIERAPVTAGLAADVSGMAEVDGAPRIILPPAPPAPVAAPAVPESASAAPAATAG